MQLTLKVFNTEVTIGGIMEKKRKKGWLIAILVVLVIILILLLSIYVLIPKIISSALSGGAASNFIPEQYKENIKEINSILENNLGQLEKIGITNEQAKKILSSIEYSTFESITSELTEKEINDTDELIDLLSKNIDLSSIDIEKIKNENFSYLSLEEVKTVLNQIKKNPQLLRIGFFVSKRTAVEILNKSKDNKTEKE